MILALFHLSYAAVAYVVFLGTIVYLWTFVRSGGGDGLSAAGALRSADAWTRALAVDVALLALFGLQQGVTARRPVRRWLRKVVPATERSTRLLLGCLTLAVVFWLWRPIAAPLWDARSPFIVASLQVLAACGALVAIVASFQIDHGELVGLAAAWRRFKQTRAPRPDFRTPPLYRWVRHPVYLGLVVSVWAVPTMTIDSAFFSGVVTALVLITIYFEEQDLVFHFGATYEEYRRRTPMLLPLPRRHEAGGHAAAVDRALADLATRRLIK